MARAAGTNKFLTDEQKKRINTCVFDMSNVKACSDSTGISQVTIQALRTRGWANESHIEKIMDFCDEVQGLTVANHAD